VPAILETRDLGMTYPSGLCALRGVSLAIGAGERVAIVGRSGAGKSTLLRLMNRLLRPTEGVMLLDGSPISSVSGSRLRDVRRQVGMIFQQFNLVGRLSVLDNVLAGWLGASRGVRTLPGLWRTFPRSAREHAMACLEEVQIADLAGQRADQLSGGQAQRVAIARVLAQGPRAILADEPIASLDPRSSEIVLDTLRRINQTRGVPIVMNLHHVDVARQHATRIIGLRDGELVWDLPIDQLSDRRLGDLYGDHEPSPEPSPLVSTPGVAMARA